MSEDEPNREVIPIRAELPVKVFKALEFLAKKRGTSMTEQLRQAISTEYYLDYFLEQSDGNGKPSTHSGLQNLPEVGTIQNIDLSEIPDPEERTDY